MAALLHAHPFAPPTRPAPRAASRRRRPGGPRLVVVTGGGRSTVALPIPAVLAVVAVAVVVAVVALRSAQGVPPTTSWPELASASVADAAPVAAPGDQVVTVTAGDTLWGIARELAPDEDPRPLVAALSRANGGTVLQVGQRLVIPAELLAG